MVRKRIIALLVITALFLCSCGSSEKKDRYSLKELYSNGEYGFYVKDGDSFYPLTELENMQDTPFIWNIGDLKCPEVTEDTPLVAVFGTNSEMPQEYYIDKYEFLSYSIGANVSIGEDGTSMWMNTSNLCPGSNIEEALGNSEVSNPAELDSINGEKYLSNIDTEVNILIGLEKNKYYDVTIFSGTQSLKASICADTAVYKKRGYTELGDPLTKTYDKYFIVNLPDNIESGYYNINGTGFFKVK